MLEDHRLPIVVTEVDVADTALREPADKAGLATLTGSLLEEGTDRHTGKQIAASIEDTGGSFGLNPSGGSLKVLTPDVDLGLGLLFECIEKASFPKDAFERIKDQQLATIDDSLTQPHTLGSNAFHAIVYGKHPFGRPDQGTRTTVEKLTVADCQAFHKVAFAPNFTTVVVVGDFKPDEMVKKIEGLTRVWKQSNAPKPEVPAPPKATAVAARIISDPTAAQVHVFIGQLGIKRDNPDYYKLLVMDNVLGTGPGFTDRLSSNLRDRQGLAYTVQATITSTAGREPGTFSGYVGTAPKDFILARDGFFREIVKIRNEIPTKQEVEDAKKYLLGSLPFRFTTLSAVARQHIDVERYGLGFGFL
jgi:zinc protease